jgi:hypothetical protein
MVSRAKMCQVIVVIINPAPPVSNPLGGWPASVQQLPTTQQNIREKKNKNVTGNLLNK